MMGVDPVAISRSALDVEWQRLQIIAQNLANQNSVSTSGGYRALTLVSGPRGDFGELLDGAVPQGVKIVGVEQQKTGVRRTYDPTHPQADGDGFVTMPDVNIANEMALLVKTARVYESNLTALSLSHQMTRRALDIGSR